MQVMGPLYITFLVHTYISKPVKVTVQANTDIEDK